MVKKRSETAAHVVTDAEAEKLADLLANKVYGQPINTETSKTQKTSNVGTVTEKAKAIGISLPPVMIEKLQDTAIKNKRAGADHKTVSALILDALERAGY
jgi:uncharacterized membrane protein